MTDLLAARLQMAMSLMFHILFAVAGIAMPLLMVLAEARWLKTRDEIYRTLAKRWCRGTAILFAVGAVTGTVLSFELGLLWPGFMEFAGPVIGLPFAMEGFAFFLEAIFLGIYLYGWDGKVPERVHFVAGILVCICGTLSGIFVVTANAWMNTPAGFDIEQGMAVNIDPWAAMWNPASLAQTSHMTIAAFQSVAFAVAAIHAAVLLRNPGATAHRKALAIALPVAVVTALIQPLSGDFSAKVVAESQPIKLAALEGQWETERGAPLRIGGWPDEEAEETRYAIEIPYLLSILAFNDPQAEVAGLKTVPPEDRPPVAITHFSFQIMVGCGMVMMLTALITLFLWWRGAKGPPQEWMTRHPWFLKLLIANGPLGLIAVEAGWIATEVGRQPWVIQGVMRTKDAVTQVPNIWMSLVSFTLLYLFLGIIVTILLKRQVFASLPGDGPNTDPEVD
ncbi:Cytochrome ubiquinol oxidase subunit I [Sulfidibacter corallicola]|uniref:Cytochrome ubiquinol oxidase subunit I n=1 Tax=Sulfidibacter corallicola TaxID=2818388 RepID=A0A8A4TPB6_SULCO|nr:cytochrome ubiquinol oxidase subunit I [Sulfidibacter corallicola]QTD51044.1 cytochrome ubiquinol oxidase subunit I [Sulfidibacter corallicola]